MGVMNRFKERRRIRRREKKTAACPDTNEFMYKLKRKNSQNSNNIMKIRRASTDLGTTRTGEQVQNKR